MDSSKYILYNNKILNKVVVLNCNITTFQKHKNKNCNVTELCPLTYMSRILIEGHVQTYVLQDHEERSILVKLFCSQVQFHTDICMPQDHNLPQRPKSETLDGIDSNSFVLILLHFIIKDSYRYDLHHAYTFWTPITLFL